jgi:hypothetical protein
MMRKRKSVAAALGMAVGFSLAGVVPAMAADLSNAKGTTCSGIAVWHFVNNQTTGVQEANIKVKFNEGGNIVYHTERETKALQSVLHFHVETSGSATLLDAKTKELDGDPVPGRLVLSDVECLTGKDKKG